MPKRKDFLNKKCGLLNVIGVSEKKGSRGEFLWDCICDCGNRINVSSGHLSYQKSCGCIKILPHGRASLNNIYSVYRCRGKKIGEFNLSKEQFKILVDGNCFYCGNSPSNSSYHERQNGFYIYNGIDRIDNSKGYSLDNCRSCCKICNKMKNNLTEKQFFDHIKLIYGKIK